jgi:AraC family transcriptional regulator
MLQKLEAGAYYGSTTHLFEREGLSIADTRFTADLIIPPHEHSNAFFCFVLNGHGTRSWPALAGDEARMHLTLFPAEMPHANCWYGAKGHVLHVEFARAWLERLDAQAKLLDRPRDFARGMPVWLAGRLAEELRRPDDVTPLAVEGLVLELLAACARSRESTLARPAPKWLEDVLRGSKPFDADVSSQDGLDAGAVPYDVPHRSVSFQSMTAAYKLRAHGIA